MTQHQPVPVRFLLDIQATITDSEKVVLDQLSTTTSEEGEVGPFTYATAAEAARFAISQAVMEALAPAVLRGITVHASAIYLRELNDRGNFDAFELGPLPGPGKGWETLEEN